MINYCLFFPEKYNIIVSGGFGQFVKNLYPNKNILTLQGGIRHLKTLPLEHISDNIKNKSFIFIDDSYYLGRTRNAIREEIERLKGSFIHSFVVYDGSIYKDKKVTSLYRYHERF